MKKRFSIISLILPLLASCNLSPGSVVPYGPADSGAASTQTFVAVQWQTLSAWQAAQTAQAAGSPAPPPDSTAAGVGTALPPIASTWTLSPTIFPTLTLSPTVTSTLTLTPIATQTPTSAPSVTSTWTSSPTITPSATPSLTVTSTMTPSPTETSTRTYTPTVTPSRTKTPTATKTPTSTLTPTPTLTPVPCNWAQFIADVNYPDDSEMGPSDHFTKTWRLKNIGSCTWTSGYSLVFDSGDRMGAPDSQQLTAGTVAPGATVDVSVDLLTPDEPGTYQGFFKLRASDSSVFGIGADANGAFWVRIMVVEPAVDPTTQSVYDQVTIAPGAVGSTTADCPGGTVVTGGGFSVSSDVLVYTQLKTGNGWSAFAKNPAASNRTLTVYATCLTFPSVSTIQVAENTTVSGGGSLATKTVLCPAGTVAVGGGFTGTSDGSVWTFFSTLSGNGWQVSVRNFGSGSKTFQVMAVCLSGATLTSTNVTASKDISPGGNGYAEISCPAGQVVTGGGWHMEVDLQIYRASWYNGKWRVYAHNAGSFTRTLQARGVCVGRP